jgi:two-component system OmpR family sensor kinase
VRRLAMNLLDNAVKFTPEGGKISVVCARAGSEYSLTVRDTGPGVPAEAQEKIFERFFRLDPARTLGSRADLGAANSVVGNFDAAKLAPEPLAGGTAGAGLGLAIARWIAEAHHGRLTLVQSDTSGSVFVAYLPANSAGGAAFPSANGASAVAGAAETAPAPAKRERAVERTGT